MDENKEITENNETPEIAPETTEKTVTDAQETEAAAENDVTDADEAAADAAEEPDTAEKSGEAEGEKEEAEEKNLLKDVVEIIESTLITVFVIVMMFTYILHPVNIVGHSMVPTLNANATADRKDTDKIFMTTVFFNVKYGDILVIDKDKNYLIDATGKPYIPEDYAPINECIIKRVIAVGGQTVDIHDGFVFVDGEQLDEPYIATQGSTFDLGAFTSQFPITIPEGYYFVMGDNREHSTDSRAHSVGLVKRDQIYGKAIIKYKPLNEFDILTDSWKGN